MAVEMEGIWKEAVIAFCSYYTFVCLDVNEENRETSAGTAAVK
jgi:hypothetical protein